MATTGVRRDEARRSAGAKRRAGAAMLLLAMLLPVTPANGGLLSDLLAPIVDPVTELVEELLDPILGDASELTGIPLDQTVDSLLDGTVDDLIGTVEELIIPDDGAPLTPPDFEDLADLAPLEPIDPIFEDVLVPDVLAPAGDALAPLADASAGLVPLSLGSLLSEVSGAVAPALEPLSLDAAAYVAQVEVPGPDGPTTLTHDGLVDVPTLFDVDRNGIDDLSVELRIVTARPSLRVTRLPGAPSQLPVAVRAILAPQGWSTPERLSVGFDATGDDLPDVARATITDLGTTSGTIAADVHAVGAGSTLALTAGQYDQGVGGTRVDPTDVHLAFTPMPADAAIRASGLLDGGSDGRVALETSEPSRVDAAVTTADTSGDTTQIIAEIDRVPGTIDLGITQNADAIGLDYAAGGPIDRVALGLVETTNGVTRSTEVGIEGIDATEATFTLSPDDLGFDASAPIDAVTLELIDPDGVADRATELRARLEGLPTDLSVDLSSGAEDITIDAGTGQVDLVEVQLTSGPNLALPADVDGVLLRDVPDHFVAFVRLTGLRAVELSSTDGLRAHLETTGARPFVADIARDAAETIVATLSALPGTVDLALTEDADGSTLEYAASDVVDELEVQADQDDRRLALTVDDLPTEVTARLAGDGIEWTASAAVPTIDVEIDEAADLGGDVANVRAVLTDVPAAFTAEFGATVRIDATPAAFGQIEVLASDGSTETAVPDGVDGLVLVDEPGAFAAAARLTGLRSLAFQPEPLTLSLATTGQRVFEVDADRVADDGSAQDIRATIDALPDEVTLSLGEDGDGSPRLDYQASDTVDSLVGSVVLTDTAANAVTIDLELHELPTELALTLADDGVDYEASAPLPLLRAEVSDPGGLVADADRLFLELTDLPTAFGVALAEGGVVSFVADGGAVGRIDALLTSGPELSLPDGVDGLYLRDTPGDFVAALTLTGLRTVRLDPTAGASIDLGTVGGRRFEVDVETEGDDGATTDVRATLDELPSDVSVSLAGDATDGFSLDYEASAVMDQLRAQLVRTAPGDPTATTASLEADSLPTDLSVSLGDDGAVTYRASDALPRLAVELTDPSGLVEGATDLSLLALDVPTGLDAALDEAGALSATTQGGELGLLEALLTSGPEIGLDGSVDGIVLRDTGDDFAVFARLTDLSGLSFATLEGGAELSLQTAAARTLEVDIATENVDEATASTIRATLDALPSSVSLALTEDETGRALDYDASGPMDRLFGDIELTDAEGTNTFAIEVLDLPSELDLDLATTGALGYTASGRIGQLSVTGDNPDGIFLRATRLQALLQDLPPTLSILLGENGDLGLDAAGDRLGHLDVLATNGPELSPVDGVVGAVIRDTAEDFVVSFRFEDVGRLAVVPDPVALEIDTAGGDVFVLDALLDGGDLIDLGDGSVSIEAIIDSLPSSATLGFGLDGGAQQLSIGASDTIDSVGFQLSQQESASSSPLTADLLIEQVPSSLDLSIDITGAVTYAASAPVPVLAIDATDPSGLFDRATQLGLRLDGLPTGLDVTLSESGAIAIDTTGGKLGRLEALATTGPDNRVPPGADGILLEDLTDRFVVSARFSNLYSGDVSQVPRPRVSLVTDGGRPLSLGLYQSEPGKPSRIPNVAYTEASLVDLPAVVDLELLEGDPGTINIAYEADSTASSLGFETNAGDRWVTEASISNPVPEEFTACQAGDTRCVNSGQNRASIGSFKFDASQHTTLSVFDCARPLNGNCTRANGSQLTHVDNLRVKTLGFEGDFDDCGLLGQQACGHLFADTDNSTLRGQIFNRDGSTEMTLNFGANFRAQNRLVRFERFPGIWPWSLSTSKSGSVSCTSGTGLNIKVEILFTLNLNGNSLLC